MGKNLIIRRGGGISPAKFDAMVNEVAISQGLLAYSNLILSADHANDLDNGKSFGFDNDNTVQYKALKGTYSESVIVNPIAGATTLILNTSAGLNIGDEYTIQDSTGTREWPIIQSIDSGTVVTLTAPLDNSYTSAYLYDYYVGNPVGVVDYDFRADVLANGSPERTYNFNGSTSKAIGGADNTVTVGSIYLEVIPNINITSATSANTINSYEEPSDAKFIGFGSVTTSLVNETLALAIGTGIRIGTTDNFTLATLYKIWFVWNGSTYDFYINGVKNSNRIIAGSPAQITIDKLRMGIQADEVSGFGDIQIKRNVIASITPTDQEALDITGSVALLSTVLTEANSEIYYDATQNSNVENLGTDVGYDLIATDITIIDTGNNVTPFTPMDLITQSYTLTNASGATLQHFAKFGTGAYNLMTETSTDHFAYEHSTEEDNIKIKTTVVGDTSQLLDIQLELGGISDV